MPHVIAEEVFRKAQEGIRNRLFKDAKESDDLLRALGTKIAGEVPGCRTSFGPIKKMARASKKVNSPKADGGYDGDWYELKDVARMTIIAPWHSEVATVGSKVEGACGLGKQMKLLKRKVVKEDEDDCGYSGLNYVIQMPNQRPVEIQVNVPELIYGKEGEDDAQNVLGFELFNQLKCKFIIEGGHGHKLYEIYREAPSSRIGRAAAQVSIEYYGYLRRGFPNGLIVEQLRKDLRGVYSMLPPPLRPRAYAFSGPPGASSGGSSGSPSGGPPPLRGRAYAFSGPSGGPSR
ncbi:hypothetical protein OJF2_37860 [Aquisphaera giovannonii]|uniref:Uncharacterized protein n=1 Tax=Aquisphaera giovannonii TaxID=406548 RepID=A0A5B9W4S6_9BACT|nr:hypothetical protein [Aquisphaera giovannonii]QEH35239.1 hypothetical protein OJF2_37860 [Aquisphaera giovannonii]